MSCRPSVAFVSYATIRCIPDSPRRYRDLWKTRPGRPTDSDDEDEDGQGTGEDFCSVVKEFIVTGFTYVTEWVEVHACMSM